MNVWLITWEWHGEHAKKKKPLIAILSSRKGKKFIASFVEQTYWMEYFTIEEIIHWANRRRDCPCKVTTTENINDILHDGIIRCGDNPHIYARKVTDFKVVSDLENKVEKLSWKELPNHRWKNKEEFVTEVAEEGKLRELEVSYDESPPQSTK